MKYLLIYDLCILTGVFFCEKYLEVWNNVLYLFHRTKISTSMKEKTRSKLRVTKKMKEAREAVDLFKKENGYPPSYRELMPILNLSSPNTVYHRLRGYRHKMIQQ